MYEPCEVATKIKKIAKENNVVIKDMMQYCGIGINTMSALYHGKVIAFDSLAKIADYLNVSVDYLLGRVNVPQVKSSDDAEILNMIQQLSLTDKAEIILILKEKIEKASSNKKGDT